MCINSRQSGQGEGRLIPRPCVKGDSSSHFWCPFFKRLFVFSPRRSPGGCSQPALTDRLSLRPEKTLFFDDN